MKQEIPMATGTTNDIARIDVPVIERYREEGFLAIADLFLCDEVEAARAALGQLMTELIEGARAGTAALQPWGGGPGNGDGARISAPSGNMLLLFEPGFDPLAGTTDQAIAHVRNLYHYDQAHPVFAKMVASPRIKGIAEQLLGEEAVHFQTMALVKPALVGSEKPWHQDNAYFKFAPLDRVVGFWMALDDATVENGCMHVLPGWHRRGGLRHFFAQDCQIMPDRLELAEPVPVELPAGGAMFFSGMLPHQTPPNRSQLPRRAIQFHYRGASTHEVEQSEYDRLFAEADGTPASCEAARN
jgi:phytanoyl-CoA hydroxylase